MPSRNFLVTKWERSTTMKLRCVRKFVSTIFITIEFQSGKHSMSNVEKASFFLLLPECNEKVLSFAKTKVERIRTDLIHFARHAMGSTGSSSTFALESKQTHKSKVAHLDLAHHYMQTRCVNSMLHHPEYLSTFLSLVNSYFRLKCCDKLSIKWKTYLNITNYFSLLSLTVDSLTHRAYHVSQVVHFCTIFEIRKKIQ